MSCLVKRRCPALATLAALFVTLPVFADAPPASATAGPAMDEPDVRRRLADPQLTGPTLLPLRLAGGATTVFRLQDSGALPRGLARRHPALRSVRGTDRDGRTLRLDLFAGGLHASLRDGREEWVFHPGSGAVNETPRMEGGGLPDTAFGSASVATGQPHPVAGTDNPRPAGGVLHYEFRLAAAASSRYVAAHGGTRESALAAMVHAVNRANEVFETDLGVHFILAEGSDRLIQVNPATDPFETHEPGPAAAELISQVLPDTAYDMGHAFTTYRGGDSQIGTSCSHARDADFLASHKAAAWSGDSNGLLISVLARQLGAWPTANGCRRDTLNDRAVEPGGGSTAMGYARAGCGGEGQTLQSAPDQYFHALNIAQIRAWLASHGGACAAKRIAPVSAPWIDPVPLSDRVVIPARTPFILDAVVTPALPRQRLTYSWEQMDAGEWQRGPLQDDGWGPLFRSMPPADSPTRVFPQMAAVLGEVPLGPGETLPATTRDLHFRLTVRDNGGANAATAWADTRVRVIDTGRPFAMRTPVPGARLTAGGTATLTWDVAGTNAPPIACHFLIAELSLDGGWHWLDSPLASDVPNTGQAVVTLPMTATDQGRLRLRCDWRPFFAVSPGRVVIH